MSGKEDIMLCRMTASHWKDNQMVPTYFVSQKPRKGYYTRIKEAIQRVPPYSRIEIVGGGTFREKVIVDKPVELGVAKASDPTSICSSSTALVLQTNECHIEGLIIEVESLTATPSCSVSIPTGSSTLKWCTVQSIEVSGTATPTVTECKILDSKAHGLLLTEASGGTYVRNSIYGHVGYSVLVESTGEPQLSYNNISCSGLGAISVKGSDASSKVCPQFMLNRISSGHATARTTVAAAHENGILPGYKLDGLEVKEVGMKVSLMPMDHYAPVMLSDDMATGGDDDAIVNNNNTRCAVLISGTYAEPVLTRNNISNCADHGLWLRGGCGGTYEGNYVASNKGWGIVVEGSKTHATFEANHVNSNTGGMKITGSPILVQGENILSGNRGPQVYIANPHADFVFQKNKVQSGSRIGVWCTGSGGGLFTQNVFENSAVAFRVELLADPVVQDCSFELCAIGVYASMASRGKFTHCTFSECSFLQCRLPHPSRAALRGLSVQSRRGRRHRLPQWTRNL
ncbi:Right handed beta helix region/Periplasmic copper-binding protein (NosD), putative [Angomonas deanei]|uniref:Right handed beta helix region/Periplasmic copper-binding protein (NosD), putative n=1 Tax=Angomonas deanei TaxID=59799 RepID=A0A7G2CM06_9TRYP|nr:Right handed beta helix region/Periplasmic copper-binding protein (NosD), putative [Angomonas deanei]